MSEDTAIPTWSASRDRRIILLFWHFLLHTGHLETNSSPEKTYPDCQRRRSARRC